jgi:hypothetical protein
VVRVVQEVCQVLQPARFANIVLYFLFFHKQEMGGERACQHRDDREKGIRSWAHLRIALAQCVCRSMFWLERWPMRVRIMPLDRAAARYLSSDRQACSRPQAGISTLSEEERRSFSRSGRTPDMRMTSLFLAVRYVQPLQR